MLPSNGALGVDESNPIFERGIGHWAVELFWFAVLTKTTHTHNISNNGNRHLYISESEEYTRCLFVLGWIDITKCQNYGRLDL